MLDDTALEYRLDQWVRWLLSKERKSDWHTRSIEWRYMPPLGSVYDEDKRSSIPINTIQAFATERAVADLGKANEKYRDVIRLHYYFTWIPATKRYAILGVSKMHYYRLLDKSKMILKKTLS